MEKCEDDITNWAIIMGNCSQGQAIAQNLSVLGREYLECCPLEERSAWIEGTATGMGCACWGLETANEIDYLDLTQMKMQWDDGDEADGSCPLSCPAVEKAHASAER